MTPTQASKKSNENEIYANLQDRRDRQQPNYELGRLVRTAEIIKVFSKSDSTNWSYEIYTNTEVIHNTSPSYRIDHLPEMFNRNLLLPTKLTLEENHQLIKKINLIQKYNK